MYVANLHWDGNRNRIDGGIIVNALFSIKYVNSHAPVEENSGTRFRLSLSLSLSLSVCVCVCVSCLLYTSPSPRD